MPKKLIAFDLDDTLAVTKSPITDEMGELLVKLLENYEVCIISGGKFEQFKLQVIDRLEANHLHLRKLHIMPTCGTRYYRYDEIDEKWALQYAEDLSESQKKKIIKTLEQEAKALRLWSQSPWGEIIEDRGSQITYSALGQQAPPEEKYKWAEKFAKEKKTLRANVANKLPDLEVRLGGTTSVDITKIGVDKAYGMHKLIDELDISKDDILFVGDKLDEGGNDYPVKAMGIDCIAVENWQNTALVIETILKLN
jgi:HAD superfamily hydrolase (TIGR01484 family)